jgi:hypothetical protein
MKLGNLFNFLRWQKRRGDRIESSDAKVFLDAKVYLNDDPHPVIDWSESGFRLTNFEGAPAPGERFSFRFELPVTSEDIFEFETWAEVVENSDRGFAAQYLNIDDALAHRIHEVLRVLSILDPKVPTNTAITYD